MYCTSSTLIHRQVFALRILCYLLEAHNVSLISRSLRYRSHLQEFINFLSILLTPIHVDHARLILSILVKMLPSMHRNLILQLSIDVSTSNICNNQQLTWMTTNARQLSKLLPSKPCFIASKSFTISSQTTSFPCPIRPHARLPFTVCNSDIVQTHSPSSAV